MWPVYHPGNNSAVLVENGCRVSVYPLVATPDDDNWIVSIVLGIGPDDVLIHVNKRLAVHRIRLRHKIPFSESLANSGG